MMAVHQSGDDDAAAAIDDLGSAACLDALCDPRDAVSVDQDIRIDKLAVIIVEGQYPKAIFEEYHVYSLFKSMLSRPKFIHEKYSKTDENQGGNPRVMLGNRVFPKKEFPCVSKYNK